MKKIKIDLSRILVFLFVLSCFLFTKSLVYAYDAPSWWNGDTCNATFYNGGSGHTESLLTTWNNIQVCGPTGTNYIDTSFPGVDQGEWQCVELVKRYLYLAFGVPAISSDGDDLVSNYASTYSNIFRSITNNGNTHEFPKIGDVLSYSDVHTAVVSNISISDPTNGDATLTLVEENAASTGTTTQQVVGWVIKGDIDDPGATGSDTVTAWLTPRSWNTVSSTNPTGTLNMLYSVTSTSPSDIWAVGYNANSGTHPIAIHWNGSSWGSNAASVSGNKLLYGVSAISSSDVLAVGDNYGTFTGTFAMRYDGSSWAEIPSDNPGSLASGFMGIGSDSSGDAWAVGNTYIGSFSNGQAMIQQYIDSTTGFQNWSPTGSTGTIPNLSGTTENVLNAVTVLSSSDAWAVGYYYDASSHVLPLAYHWNGSTWSNVSIPYPSGNTHSELSSIAADSSNNVWAVGYSEGTHRDTYVVHWDGSSWTNISSPNLSQYPYYLNKLTAVSIASNGIVYTVGSMVDSSGNTKTMAFRYNSSHWYQLTTSNPNIYTNELLGVTANGINSVGAMAVGDYLSGSNIATLTEELY